MIEIKNRQRFPVQLVVKSRTAPKAFTTLIIPGVGKGKNFYVLEDELNTEYVERAEKMGWISTRHLPNKENKGE